MPHPFPRIGQPRTAARSKKIVMVDPISDMLIRIKNAQAVRHEQVSMPFSKMKWAVASILKDTGYVSDIERKKKPAKPGRLVSAGADSEKKSEHEHLILTLKYQQGLGAVSGMKMVSKPSRRMYLKTNEIHPVRSGHGIAILSTSKGVMSSREAKKQGLGGEIICEVW